MVRELISGVILIIFPQKHISEHPDTYSWVANPSRISIFVIHYGMKHKLWHLQAQIKCLHLCFHSQEFHFCSYFEHMFTQSHFRAPIYFFLFRDQKFLPKGSSFSGIETFSDFNILHEYWHKTWTMATANKKLSQNIYIYIWSSNFINALTVQVK